MIPRTTFLIAVVVGLVVGWISAHGIGLVSAVIVIPWGLIGGIIGASIRIRRTALWAGVIYGIMLTWAFLSTGFRGSHDQLFGLLVLIAMLSVVGALGGFVTAFVGHWVGSRLRSTQ